MIDTTRIGERGQVVIPKLIRDKLKIKKGAIFIVDVKKETVILKPLKNV